MTPINHAVYRGKGPDPHKKIEDNDKIKADTLSKGFSLQGKMERFDQANAVELLKLFSGFVKLRDCSTYFQEQVRLKNIQLPMKSPDSSEPLDPNANLYKPDALSPLIISSGSGAGPFLSTDPDPACGGYASGRYIFKLDVAGLLSEYDWMDVLPGTSGRASNFWPKLWLLTGKPLAESPIIAIAHQGRNVKEVTFLTPIPASHAGHRIISLYPVDKELGNIDHQ